MMIPAPIIKLHKPDSVFDKSPCQQAVVGERWIIPFIKNPRVGGVFRLRNMSWLRPVKIENVFRFFTDIHHFGNGHLHPKSQFVL